MSVGVRDVLGTGRVLVPADHHLTGVAVLLVAVLHRFAVGASVSEVALFGHVAAVVPSYNSEFGIEVECLQAPISSALVNLPVNQILDSGPVEIAPDQP